MRIARPAGVRYSTQPMTGTSSSASSVMRRLRGQAVRPMPSSQAMGANGVTVGGVSTFGKLTR